MLARRPTLWVELGVALSWAVLAAGSSVLDPGGAAGDASRWSGGGALWLCTTGIAHVGSGVAGPAELLSFAAHPASLAAMLPMLSLMAIAMMAPAAMPAVRHVAVNSLYWRRRRAVVEFLVAFLGI